MTSEMSFFVIFLITIIITRIFLYFKPTPSPTIKGFRLHHYMLGIVLGLIGVAFENLFLYAIGIGLFIDELPFLIFRGKTHEDNYSKKSLILLGIFIILIYFLRLTLTRFL